MGEAIFFLIIIIPALYGFAELIHILKVYIISPKTSKPKYLIIFLGADSPCKQLALAAEELFWYGKKYAHGIIAVNCGMPEDEYQICSSFCNKNSFILCNKDELHEYLDIISCRN